MKKNCVVCNKEFEAKSVKGKYCSDACKMAASRAKGKIVITSTAIDEKIDHSVPPAEAYDIPFMKLPLRDEPYPFSAEAKHSKGIFEGSKGVMDAIKNGGYDPWIAKIRDFCGNEGIMPEDLIGAYNELKNSKQEQEKKKDIPVIGADGKKSLKNREMVEPKPGTNAYFVRHGKWE